MIIKQEGGSTHWYDKSGNPKYTVTDSKGKERPTNLRDARILSLVPSVTTILSIIAKPALNIWMQEQVLLAALTLPKRPDESESDWLNRVIRDSRESSKKARDRGTDIHDAIEMAFKGDYRGEYINHANNVKKALNEHFGALEWISEQSFASEMMFGGKCDLHSPSGVVVDFKTTDKPLEKVAVYDDHAMQLAAYRVGLGIPEARCANIFVHTSGEVILIEHKKEELERGWAMFKDALSLWRNKNKY